MSGSRGLRFRVLAGTILAFAPLQGCNPTYKWNPEDALPGSGDPQAANPPSESGCEWAGAGTGAYVKRILVESLPIQVASDEQLRLDAAVLGLRHSYYTCGSVDSIVAVAEQTNQYVPTVLNWNTSSGLAQTPIASTSWSVLATVKATPPLSAQPKPGPSPIVRPEAVIDVAQFVAFPGANSEDRLHTWFVPGTRTNVAMVGGFTSGKCENDRLVVFTNRADLGQWTGDCLRPDGTVERASELVLFSETGAALRPTFKWTTGKDKRVLGVPDDSSPDEIDPIEPITIPVKVWFSAGAPPTDETWSFIKESIELADVLLTRNRTGLRVKFTGESTTNVELNLGSPSETCEKLGQVHFSDAYPKDAVHLFVTQKADLVAGFSCRIPSGVILLGDGTGAITFAHELGHTLSLRVFPNAGESTSREDPRTGHVDNHPNIGDWNVMFSTVSDAASQLRTQITLGQAFRMNFDSRSWITLPGTFQMESVTDRGQAVKCQNTADDDGPCPRLDLDLTVLYPVVPEPQTQ